MALDASHFHFGQSFASLFAARPKSQFAGARQIKSRIGNGPPIVGRLLPENAGPAFWPLGFVAHADARLAGALMSKRNSASGFRSFSQVGSLQSPQFADVNGYAATGTILYSIPEEGLNNWAFEIFMPYTAFNVNAGSYINGQYQYTRTYIYAIPTLFIDNFGYAKGEPINFYVDK